LEIRDPVHGSINILKEEEPIISDPFFERLRNIKQLGFSEFIFPGATHTRFIHSIGVMHVGERVFNKLFKNFTHSKDLLRLKETFKLACLLHDIGHAPLSHSTEVVMPEVEKLNLSTIPANTKRQATHEDYTVKIIIDSSFTNSLKDVKKKFGVIPLHIAELVIGSTNSSDYFKIEGICYFKLLHQLVSSELDCDRMDYLLRDSYFCGVSYGKYDLDWLIENLLIVTDKLNNASLGISERAVVTFDDFLLSRYHMFIMVYFHYRSVCLEQLLFKYFKYSNNEYTIPFEIEKYIEHDDHYLLKILRNSNNKFAKLITSNKVPTKIFESFNTGQLKILKKIEKLLKENSIDYIRSSSASRLSKYYNEENQEIKVNINEILVVRSEHLSNETSSYPIHQATEVFSKFSKSHEINRLHCDFDKLSDDLKTSIIKLRA